MKKSSHGGQTPKLLTIRYSAPNPLVNYGPGAEIKFAPDEKYPGHASDCIGPIWMVTIVIFIAL